MVQKTEGNNYNGLLLRNALAIEHAMHAVYHTQDTATLLRA
jgi:hypothetical protein